MTWKSLRIVLLSVLTSATLITFIVVLFAPAPPKFLQTPPTAPSP